MKTRTKTNIKYWLLAIALCLPINWAYADLDIPGISGVVDVEGSDGDLAPVSNITIDLSLATTGNWDSPGDGNGVYDPVKWAVVFKYNSVNIPVNVAVTFTNHPSGAPVVWLVTGDVAITGLVNLNGAHSSGVLFKPTIPGPGGFAGGNGQLSTTFLSSSGFGPGGAVGRHQDSGSYSSLGFGDLPGELYGNTRILQLIGGSGGSGASNVANSGGAGGGAILIVSTQDIIFNYPGAITAHGGLGSSYSGFGSGGAVRLIADSIGGTGGIYVNSTGLGDGYIRLETLNYTGGLSLVPVVPVNTPDEPLQLWPPEAAPSVRVVSIGAQTVPSDPSGRPEATNFDLQLDNESSSDIILETKNVPANAIVRLRIIPVNGDSVTETAVFSNGTDALSTWVVSNVTLPAGGFVVQAHSINPIQ